MTPDELAELIAQEFPHTEAVEITHGQLTIDVSADAWVEALRYARNSLACYFFAWLSAVDEGEDGIRLLMRVYSPSQRHRGVPWCHLARAGDVCVPRGGVHRSSAPRTASPGGPDRGPSAPKGF